MGVFLSTPSTDKFSEEGTDGRLLYGASAMQGWRRSMEDAHIAHLDFGRGANNRGGDNSSETTDMALFGVFDGHGGKEVAKFAAAHLGQELRKLEEFKEGDYARALVRVFHRIDDLLESGGPQVLKELAKYRKEKDPSDQPKDGGRGGGFRKKRSSSDHSASPAKSPHYMNQDDSDDDDMDQEDTEITAQDSLENTPGGGAIVKAQGGAGGGVKEKASLTAAEALDLFQKLLQMSGRNRNANHTDSAGEESKAEPERVVEPPPETPKDDDEGGGVSPLFRAASGREVCTLADHPIVAGCTSVVALLVGDRLFVANAGDSRAVVSRDGKAVDLSEDHKPSLEREATRIRNAGGFVTQVGRVNGNLNLCRSLGDLKYKANKSIPRKDQIITAEPDITVHRVSPQDEFLILACDGVWDIMSSQAAVDFVRQRIDRMSPALIAEELFDYCIADDPRKTTGLGGDNMTCIIVKFNPPSASP